MTTGHFRLYQPTGCACFSPLLCPCGFDLRSSLRASRAGRKDRQHLITVWSNMRKTNGDRSKQIMTAAAHLIIDSFGLSLLFCVAWCGENVKAQSLTYIHILSNPVTFVRPRYYAFQFQYCSRNFLIIANISLYVTHWHGNHHCVSQQNFSRPCLVIGLSHHLVSRRRSSRLPYGSSPSSAINTNPLANPSFDDLSRKSTAVVFDACFCSPVPIILNSFTPFNLLCASHSPRHASSTHCHQLYAFEISCLLRCTSIISSLVFVYCRLYLPTMQ